MRRFSRNISVVAFSIATVGLLGVAPVSALAAQEGTVVKPAPGMSMKASDSQQMNMESMDGSMDMSSSGSGSSGDASSSTMAQDDGTTTPSKVQIEQRLQEIRAKAQQRVAEAKKNGKLKSAEARQKACEARQTSIDTRLQNFSRIASNHLDTFNSIYTKVLAFQTDKNLSSSDFASLKATADTKKMDAATAISALSSLNAKVDCTADNPATQVATWKSAVDTARTALQDYRTAIKNVIVSLLTAKATTNTTTSTTEAQ